MTYYFFFAAIVFVLIAIHRYRFERRLAEMYAKEEQDANLRHHSDVP